MQEDASRRPLRLVSQAFIANLARKHELRERSASNEAKAFRAPIISRLIAEADSGAYPLARAPVVELAEARVRNGEASVGFGV